MRFVVAVLAVTSTFAVADPETAKQLSSAAEVLAARGELIAAAAKFREAFVADPRPEYTCNVGVAYYKADDLPRAHRYLRDCQTIGTSLDQAYLDNVRAVIDSVEARLATGDYFPVDFVVEPATATITIATGVPHDEPIVGSRRIWFPFGSYALTIAAAGFTDQQLAIDRRTRDPLPSRIKLERPLAPAVEPVVPIVVAPPQPLPESRPPAYRPALIASMVTVGVGITAGVLYWRSRSLVGEAEDQTDFAEFDDRRDRARTFQRASWIVGGLAGAGAAVSGYLWVRAFRTSPRVEVTSTGDGGIVSIRGAL